MNGLLTNYTRSQTPLSPNLGIKKMCFKICGVKEPLGLKRKGWDIYGYGRCRYRCTYIHPARAQVPLSYQSERVVSGAETTNLRRKAIDGNGTSVRLCKHAGDAANHESKF